ncbi:GGDEF domain-containing protein [Streptomyces cyaneofuscatus]|uniref:GGDEF domain-containing protein n=1 Tax=Streptomyces cyaneofuscatus TaxID=66883 RepID=UPI00364DC84D
MHSALRTRGRFGPHTLLITAAAVPLTGWAVHAGVLHKRLKHDPLTGLLRRDAYTARARRILARHGDTAAVVMVDADHFKAVNDTLGHAAGDAVLASFGARLTTWAGPRASVGRLGGDEFAVVLELTSGHREQRLEQLVRMLHTPVVLDDGRAVDVAASIGAAASDLLGTRDLTTLQRAADAALYAGKHSGRAVLATATHATTPSINGRRAGRSGAGGRGETCPVTTAAHTTEEASE